MITVRTRRLLLWVALPALVLVLLYTVLGFFLVPHLIRSGLHDFVSKNYHRDVAIGDIRFNPYTLRLDVRDFALPDAGGQPMLSFRHLLVDLTVASVWRWGPDFESILLEQPFVRVLIKPDGTLNLSELALPPSPEAKPQPNAKPLRLFINHFSVQGGNVAFDDRAHPSEFSTEIKPITFDLRNFSTVGKESGTYALSGASDAGERFSWSGSVSSLPLSSRGQFEVANLKAHTIWDYVRDSVGFELPSGVISIAGDYDFTTATTPQGLAVNVHEVTVTDLDVRPKGSTQDYVKLARLEVHDTRADVAKRTVDVGSVRLVGGEVRAWVPGAAGATVNLMELLGPSGAAGAPAGAETHGVAPTGSPAAADGRAAGPTSTAAIASTSGGASSPDASAPPPAPEAPVWVVAVPNIELDSLKISVEDRHVSPAVSMRLDDLRIHIKGFTTLRTTPVSVAMSTKINRDGKLDAKADLSPDFTAMKGQADLTNLDLTVFQPYIAERTAMTLLNGLLSAKLSAERAADGHLAVAGGVDVAKLRTIDNDLKRDFIKFDRLQVDGLDYQANPSNPSTPASLHIKNVVARAPYARVIIESNRSVNVKRVLSGRGGSSPASAANSGTQPSSDASAANGAASTDAVAAVASAPPDSADAHAAISIGTAQGPKTAPPPIATSATAATPAPGAPTAAQGSASTAAPAPTTKNAAVAAAPAPAAGPSPAAASAPAPKAASVAAASTAPTAAAGPASAPAPKATSVAASTPAGRAGPKRRGGKSTPAPAPAPSNDGAMAIAIDAINIQDASANYADLWIQPHFAVGIQTLNGSILGLSSDPRSRAKIELKGKVDRYAPVHIWGETNPLATTTYTDVRMSFKGVELTSATPYSGHFAGYKIEKGKLSVDIDYKIENRKLTAAHKFVIDQLELGERVDSPDAVKLPLKIAVALLKDRNGVIDVDLPVTGSLDDPQFKLGPLIWKAVLNLLVKAATAPFALLGHLFGGGGGEELKYIDFKPGSAVLQPSERDKLGTLVKALKEKEKLELDVPLTFSPDLDRPGLAAAQLNARLLELSQDQAGGNKRGKARAKTNTAGTSGKPKGTPAGAESGGTALATSLASTPQADTPRGGPPDDSKSSMSALMDEPPPSDPALTDPAQRYRLLVALYRAELGKNTPLPDLAKAIEAGKKKDPPPDFGAANAELEAALLQKMPVPDNELQILAKHRARAIQDVLLVGTDIDPSRVFVIGTAPKDAADKDKVRVELALK
jgi:hypothetical protein